MSNNYKRIRYLIQFLRNLKGMKYVVFVEPQKTDGPPLWCIEEKLPPLKSIFNSGSACVGLSNIIRRKQGLSIPRNNKIDLGGTESWFKYLKNKKRLEKINNNKIYPIGSLLIQDYNSNDQGHVAIITFSSKKGLCYSKIIHSVSGKFGNKIYDSCVEEKLIDYPYNNRFTHICKPENWIFKD